MLKNQLIKTGKNISIQDNLENIGGFYTQKYDNFMVYDW